MQGTGRMAIARDELRRQDGMRLDHRSNSKLPTKPRPLPRERLGPTIEDVEVLAVGKDAMPLLAGQFAHDP